MRVRRALLGFAVVGVLAATIPAADAAPQGMFGIRVVGRSDDGSVPTSVSATAHAGSRLERRIAVDNLSDAPLHLRVYAGAATMSSGTFTFGAPGDTNEASSWTRVTPSTFDLAPGREAQADVVLDVPRAAPPGKYYAVIWAEPSGRQVGGLTVVNRVGVRVYLTVDAHHAVTAHTDTSSMVTPAVAIALIALGAGLVLVFAARRLRRHDANTDDSAHARRRNPWPKKPPRGRAWA